MAASALERNAPRNGSRGTLAQLSRGTRRRPALVNAPKDTRDHIRACCGSMVVRLVLLALNQLWLRFGVYAVLPQFGRRPYGKKGLPAKSSSVFTRLMMIESLWIVPLVLIIVVMLALGIFWVAEPRRSREDPQPRS